MEFLLLGFLLGAIIIFVLPALVSRMCKSKKISDLVRWWES
jgi:hypothetical protein